MSNVDDTVCKNETGPSCSENSEKYTLPVNYYDRSFYFLRHDKPEEIFD